MIFVTPHSDGQAHNRVKSESLLAIKREFERDGISLLCAMPDATARAASS